MTQRHHVEAETALVNSPPAFEMIHTLLQRRSVTRICGFLILMIVSFVCLRLDFGSAVVDRFHEGEYLGLASSVGIGPPGFYPILAHGMLDYIPYDIAWAIWGPDRTISSVRAINAFLTGLTMLTFAHCLFAMAGRRYSTQISAAILTVVLFISINGYRIDHPQLHQGAPSVRDLFLFIELSFIIALLGEQNFRANLLFSILLGISAAVGLFWSYNRGLIGIAILSVFLLDLLIIKRKVQQVSVICLSGAAVIALIAMFDPNGILGHLNNIYFWLSAPPPDGGGAPRSVEHHLFRGTQLLIAASACLSGTLLFSTLHAKIKKQDDPLPVTLAVILLLLNLAFVQIALSRPDVQHTQFGIPCLILTLIGVLQCFRPGNAAMAPLPLIGLCVGAGLIFGSLDSTWASVGAIKRNLSYVVSGFPANGTLVSHESVAVAAALRTTHQRCLVNFDNDGMRYLQTGLPSCSRFTYLSYARSDSENSLINDLDRTRPEAIIWASNLWSFRIDGETAVDRMPNLGRWVLRNYPHRVQIGNTAVLTRNPPATRMTYPRPL